MQTLVSTYCWGTKPCRSRPSLVQAPQTLRWHLDTQTASRGGSLICHLLVPLVSSSQQAPFQGPGFLRPSGRPSSQLCMCHKMVLLFPGFFQKSQDWLSLTQFRSHVRQPSSHGPGGWSALMWPGLCVYTWLGPEGEPPLPSAQRSGGTMSASSQLSRGRIGNRVLIPQPMGTCPPTYKVARPPEASHPRLGAPEPSQTSP